MYDVPNRFKHLSIWSPVDGAVWAGYGFFIGVALLEEAHHWGWAQRAAGLFPFQFSLSVSCV